MLTLCYLEAVMEIPRSKPHNAALEPAGETYLSDTTSCGPSRFLEWRSGDPTPAELTAIVETIDKQTATQLGKQGQKYVQEF